VPAYGAPVKTVLATSLLLATLVQVVPSGIADAAAPRPTCQGRPATIVGVTHQINGTARADVIVVLADGNNYIRAGGGNDLVCGGDGHDFLYDGKGRDRFYGGGGQDFLEQESVERDFFDGGPGFDAVDYSARTEDQHVNLRNRKSDDGAPGEHDTLLSIGSVYTGSGNDILIAGREENTDGKSFPAFQDYYLISGPGNDLLIGGPLGELMSPGPGEDVVKAKGGRDFIDATDDTGIDGYQPFKDVVDGGHDDEPDRAICDELDYVTNVTQLVGC
jgi:Ca2+-binding RTX toxin-like protein